MADDLASPLSRDGSARTRARAAALTAFAVALTAVALPCRSDVAHLLIRLHTAAAYAPAREVLAGLATGPAPDCAAGAERPAIARRLAADAHEAPDAALRQLQALLTRLVDVWTGMADEAELALLRIAESTVAARMGDPRETQ